MAMQIAVLEIFVGQVPSNAPEPGSCLSDCGPTVTVSPTDPYIRVKFHDPCHSGVCLCAARVHSRRPSYGHILTTNSSFLFAPSRVRHSKRTNGRSEAAVVIECLPM